MNSLNSGTHNFHQIYQKQYRALMILRALVNLKLPTVFNFAFLDLVQNQLSAKFNFLRRNEHESHSFRTICDLVRPPPIHNIGAIDTVFVGIVSASNLLVFEHFLNVSAGNLELGNSVNYINGNAKAIDLVLNCQV